MALTRKMLSAMGIDDEKQDEIINAHIEVVNALKEERDNFKMESQKAEKLQKEVEELQESMKNGERSPYKVKYEAKVEEYDNLKKEFDDYKNDISAKELKSKKSSAYRDLLKEAGISEKRLNSIVRVTDLDKVELDDEGKIKDSEELAKNIKNEWSDFIVTESTHGANVSNPPSNTGGGKKSKDEIMAIKDTAARQQAMLENKELFI